MDAWGKFQPPDNYHRLENHCADVAACFEALLLDPVLKARFEHASGSFGFSETTAARLTVLAFLHDLGKLNTGFQFKVRDRKEFSGAPHKSGHIGVALLAPNEICEALGLFEIYRAWGNAVDPLLHAALCHHGRPARRQTVSGRGPQDIWKPFAGYDPAATAALLRERIRSWFPEAFFRRANFARYARVAASVCRSRRTCRSDRVRRRVLRIRTACRRAVYRPCAPDRRRCRRSQGIPETGTVFRTPRPQTSKRYSITTSPALLRKSVTEAPLDCPLLILESETGSGKTEAAILRFAALCRAGICRRVVLRGADASGGQATARSGPSVR